MAAAKFMSEVLSLRNKGILITRASGQLVALQASVEALGGEAFVFPVLEIDFTPAEQLQHSLVGINAKDLLIFVSMNAVYGVFRQDTASLNPDIFKASIAAVGTRTQKALLDAGLEVDIQSLDDQQNSEGLLQHPALQEMSGRRVFIIRAQSGRDTLKQVLTARGASVHYIQAYQRGMPPEFDASAIIQALSDKAINVVLLTSHDAFLNLMQMLGKQANELLRQTSLIVPSKRVADQIRCAYPFSVRVAENASDAAMLAQAAEA